MFSGTVQLMPAVPGSVQRLSRGGRGPGRPVHGQCGLEARDEAGPRQAAAGHTGPGRPGKELDFILIAFCHLQKALPNVSERADHHILCTTVDCDEKFTITIPRILSYVF